MKRHKYLRVEGTFRYLQPPTRRMSSPWVCSEGRSRVSRTRSTSCSLLRERSRHRLSSKRITACSNARDCCRSQPQQCHELRQVAAGTQ